MPWFVWKIIFDKGHVRSSNVQQNMIQIHLICSIDTGVLTDTWHIHDNILLFIIEHWTISDMYNEESHRFCDYWTLEIRCTDNNNAMDLIMMIMGCFEAFVYCLWISCWLLIQWFFSMEKIQIRTYMLNTKTCLFCQSIAANFTQLRSGLKFKWKFEGGLPVSNLAYIIVGPSKRIAWTLIRLAW